MAATLRPQPAAPKGTASSRCLAGEDWSLRAWLTLLRDTYLTF